MNSLTVASALMLMIIKYFKLMSRMHLSTRRLYAQCPSKKGLTLMQAARMMNFSDVELGKWRE